ncbi:hypothetical protein [Dactylosporangium sp. NPDC000521]|uniref:hypothetical protein n=1 Tax=Dactylosporangium sp. NPDC000521 TaxID=3363975 RepID=UPI003697AC94
MSTLAVITASASALTSAAGLLAAIAAWKSRKHAQEIQRRERLQRDVLTLIGRMNISPGDTVTVSNETFTNALRILDSFVKKNPGTPFALRVVVRVRLLFAASTGVRWQISISGGTTRLLSLLLPEAGREQYLTGWEEEIYEDRIAGKSRIRRAATVVRIALNAPRLALTLRRTDSAMEWLR